MPAADRRAMLFCNTKGQTAAILSLGLLRRWLMRAFGFPIRTLARWRVFRLFAGAPLHVFLAVAERRLEAGVGLLPCNGHHLLNGAAGVLVIVQLGGSGAFRLAHVRVTLEVIGER